MNKNSKEFSLHSAMELAEPIAVIINYLTSCILERVSEGMPILETDKIETLCKQLALSQTGVLKQLESLGNNQQLLDNANKVNVQLSEQFYRNQIIMPMVRSLLPVADLIAGTEEKVSDFDINIRTNTLRNLQAVRAQLYQFLAAYGIRAYQHETEETYDPKIMRAVRTIQTSEEALDSRIAEPLQCGFMMNDEVIRFETVSLYKYI